MAIALWSANQIHLNMAVYTRIAGVSSPVLYLLTVHLLILTVCIPKCILVRITFVDVGE